MTYFFDLDGTLIDSKTRHYLLMAEIFALNSIKLPEDFNHSYMSYKEAGNSGFHYLSDVLKMDLPTAQIINREWIKKIEEDRWLSYDSLYEDSLETLQKCKKEGIEIVYLTSRSNVLGTYKEIERLGISGYADAVIVVDPNHPTYSKKDVIQKWRNNTGTLVIGDTENDYIAAIEAGSEYYIVNRGFRNIHYWNGRDIVSYENLKQLPVWSLL